MKHFLTANLNEGSKRYNSKAINLTLKVQIENTLDCGWKPGDILLIANFDFKFMGVQSLKIDLNDFCWTGSKIFALKWYFDNNEIKDIIWARDLDCWNNAYFTCPEFDGDVGGVQYSNPKWNGGSIFWKSSSKDIIEEIAKELTENKAIKEEPLLNQIFKSKDYRNRISKLDHTYNVGCSGFVPRYKRSIKPIKVCHFNPENSIAWEIHALDRDRIGEIAVTIRLERLLRKYYPFLATSLRRKGNKKV